MGSVKDIIKEMKKTVGQTSPLHEGNRSDVLNDGTRLLEESLGAKYPGLMEQATSSNPHEQHMACLTAIMCDRTERMVNAAKEELGESTVTQSLGQLHRKLMDVVRIFYPNQIAGILTDIQPLERKNGEIFIIRPKFTNTAAGVTAGDEVFTNATDGTYATEELTSSLGTGDGSTVTFGATLTFPVRTGTIVVKNGGTEVGTDDGAGALTGATISSGTINYDTGVLSVTFTVAPASSNAITAEYCYSSEVTTTEIRQLEFGLDLVPVTAKQHPLLVNWSIQAGLAANAALNIDVPDVLSNLAAQFIRSERDTRIVKNIIASAPATTSMNFNAAAGSINYSKEQFYGELELKVNNGESTIHAANGRGGVSWVLGGYNVIEILKNAKSFQAEKVQAPIGPYKAGTLRDGTVDVVLTPNTSYTNTMVVGYKGYMPGDSAVILADWVPIYFTPIYQAPTLTASRGIMSLYDLFINNANYFAKGTVSNFGA